MRSAAWPPRPAGAGAAGLDQRAGATAGGAWIGGAAGGGPPARLTKGTPSPGSPITLRYPAPRPGFAFDDVAVSETSSATIRVAAAVMAPGQYVVIVASVV